MEMPTKPLGLEASAAPGSCLAHAPAAAAATGCPMHPWVLDVAGSTTEVVTAASRTDRPDPDEVRGFFELYREHSGMPELAWRERLAEVAAEIEASGTYAHTSEELTLGAKLAWLNHTRCIGKLYWRSLAVRDCRHVTSPDAVRDACFDHLDWAANDGRVRPLITIFAPDRPGDRAPRIRNAQMVAYAGYRAADGSLIGDGGTTELTELARSCGWSPGTEGPFDLLPLILESADGTLDAYPVPPGLADEVPIEHPTIAGLSELGLKWYGMPTISNMAMSIGGITYPTAPFTGWYMAPELSARDFTDPHRYDMLPAIAEALGLDTSDQRSLWKDRAIVELTTAVLHSYDRAGMRIDDHHAASTRFTNWVAAERRKGREVDVEWAWMISPLAASSTSVFHGTYPAEQRLPNFLRPAP